MKIVCAIAWIATAAAVTAAILTTHNLNTLWAFVIPGWVTVNVNGD